MSIEHDDGSFNPGADEVRMQEISRRPRGAVIVVKLGLDDGFIVDLCNTKNSGHSKSTARAKKDVGHRLPELGAPRYPYLATGRCMPTCPIHHLRSSATHMT